MKVMQRNNVRLLGRGPQTLLFVNGLGCDQRIWHHLTASLIDQYTMVLFDHVGAGLSDSTAYKEDKYGSLQGYASDLLDICRYLQLSQVVLIGHSVGAIIGALAAVAEPDMFQQLVMLAPTPCFLNQPGYYGGFERAEIDALLAFMEADYVGWADTYGPVIMGAPNNSSLSRELIESFCQTNPLYVTQLARLAFLSDTRPELARLLVPTLVVQCRYDALAPPEVGRYLRASMPEATLVTLPISGHCPHVSAPAATYEALQAFLAAKTTA